MRIRSIYLTTAAVLALGVVSPAAAQSLSDAIGQPVIDQMRQYTTGNWVNRAINVAPIDASVDITANHNIEQVNIGHTTTDIGDTLNTRQESSSVNGVIAGILNITEDSAYSVTSNYVEARTYTGGAIVASTAEISTVAAGAINTGHIASVGTAASSKDSFSFDGSLDDLTYLDGEVSSAAASTTNTSAEAFGGSGVYASLGGLNLSSSMEFASASSGPAAGVYAVNEAYNNAGINGSVSIIANGTDLAGISSLAAGALNTGSISFGFDGAALNSAINGGD